MKTAIVIGATGLVGRIIVTQLLSNPNYSTVKIFTRRTLKIINSKLEEHIVDFDDIDQWKKNITGDHLFSAMGTTIKVAGSKSAQYKIDYTYPFRVAQQAKENGVSTFCLISSAGANENSKVFYSKMKGELDRDVQNLLFEKTIIARPSIIDGERKESRLGEKVGIAAMRFLKHVPGLKKYEPAPASDIAKCLIKGANDNELKGTAIFEWNAVLEYAST